MSKALISALLRTFCTAVLEGRPCPLLARMRSDEQRHLRLLPGGKQTVPALTRTAEFDPRQTFG